MAEVTITYCAPCRYRSKALQDADAILEAFGTALRGVRIVPGDHGVYDVAVDGHVVFSMDEEERFPETGELLGKIRPRLAHT
ncbi:MAG: Rdx family protein [Methanobacteriota archaeon]